jgi:hypothetical protein
MFEQELELCRLAFKRRQADAFERADRLRTKLMAELLGIRTRIMARLGGTGGKGNKIDDRTRIGRIEAAKERLEAAQEARPIRDALEILDEIEKQYGKSVDGRIGGETPEQLLQAIGASRYSDPVLRLMAKGKLTVEQVLAAREIASICRHIVRDAKTTYFPVASDNPSEGKVGRREAFQMAMDHGEFMALLHSHVYLAWSDKVRKDLPLVFGLCVEGRPVEELRRLHRLDWKTVLDRIKSALDAYIAIRAGFNPERPVKEPRSPLRGSTLPIPALSKAR